VTSPEPHQNATPRLSALTGQAGGYNFAFLDELSKKEVRRALLKAVAIPGYQVPFGSREMPIGRGWGTGGLQVTLSIVRPDDTLKVIDQGTDASVNALNIRRLVERTAPGVRTTTDTVEATVIQSRHRIPEEPLRADQIVVLQVPLPEILRMVEPRERVTRRLHAEAEYTRVWVHLYEDIVTHGEISRASGYPVLVNDRYMMSPSPIPRWDLHRLNQAAHLTLLGAGREKRIYAVPPYTDVVPLDFEDYPFRVEGFSGKRCARCGATDHYLDELIRDDGARVYACSDTAACEKRQGAQGAQGALGAQATNDERPESRGQSR
jgi:alpha-D-ribose 1-methylphosphonate 5-phosphate C-P lyase